MAEPSLPVTEKPSAPVGPPLHPAFYIASWIFFSNLTILFNKWLLDSAGFPTQILARTTKLLDGRKTVKMTGRVYLRAVMPIGLLYSGSLVCSNLVYLYLSVPFIQMLKAAAPVAVLITSWVWGVANPSVKTFLNVMLIVVGVGLASAGEIEFSWVGFFFQVGGIVFEAMRLVMIQVMLSEEGQGMDPLVSLYYYAPVCAVMNFIVAWLSEASKFQWDDFYQTGMGILLLNAGVAFMLNVSSVFLIGKTSGLVMTLTGILKNILLIVAGVMIWGTSITALQLFGYMIALGGLVYYSLGWEQIVTLSQGAATWAKNFWESPSLDESRLSPLVKRTIMMVLAVIIGALLIAGFLYSGSDSVQMSARGS